MVKRDVVRLVTPGTITEDKLLAPSESNILMALGRVKGGAENSFALAWIEISTGIFRVAETNADRLLADIFRVDPRELIVAEPVFYDPELKPVFDVLGRVASPQPAALFDSALGGGPHRALLRRRDAGQLRHVLAAPSCRRSPASIAYVEKTQKAERPPLSVPSARSTARRCSSIRRRAPIWSCCARCRAAATARCSRRSTAR